MSTPQVEKNIRKKIQNLREDLRKEFPDLIEYADEIDENMKHQDIYTACGHAYDTTKKLVHVANNICDYGDHARFQKLYRIIQDYRKQLNKGKKFLN